MACSGGGTCTCGCCAGISQETPQTQLNRPGLSAIPYRVGTYQQFNDTLQARISLSGQPQLRALTTREDDDFTIALLDAFSVMADVLTFYTERYGNESYLRTAVQRQSVVDLAALVGYEPSPGVAANTALAFKSIRQPERSGRRLPEQATARSCLRQARRSRFRLAHACKAFQIIRPSSRSHSRLRRIFRRSPRGTRFRRRQACNRISPTRPPVFPAFSLRVRQRI